MNNPRRTTLLAVALFLTLCCLDTPLAGQENSPVTEPEELDNESKFYTLVHDNRLPDAEKHLERVLQDKNADRTVLANMLLTLGNQLITAGKVPDALKWLTALEKDFGDLCIDDEGSTSFRTLVAPKIAWLQAGGARGWAAKDPIALGRLLIKGLQAKDITVLEKSLAAVDTYVGWWESEYEVIPRDSVLEHLKKFFGENISWVNEGEFVQAAGNKPDVLYVNTHGWLDMEGFTNIQFALHAVPEGWEWRGIVLGESPTASSTTPSQN